MEKSNSMEYFSKFPVIFLTFKDVKNNTKEENQEYVKKLIMNLYSDYRYLIETLDEYDKNNFEKMLYGEEKDFSLAVYNLSKYLYEYYNKNVVILIDEYDTPINTAYVKGYYDEIIGFYRSFYSSIFKDNKYLEKGVITGINRMAREGIFSGLNNISLYTVLDNDFKESFGFTEKEVKKMLKEYELESEFDEVKKWYNGYNFGDVKIYNPWSIIKYLESQKLDIYWVNTSSNEEITKSLKEVATKRIFDELEKLVKGETIKARINENVVINDLKNPDELWSLMLNSGYLTSIGEKRGRQELQIPNFEIQQYFSEVFKEYI